MTWKLEEDHTQLNYFQVQSLTHRRDQSLASHSRRPVAQLCLRNCDQESRGTSRTNPFSGHWSLQATAFPLTHCPRSSFEALFLMAGLICVIASLFLISRAVDGTGLESLSSEPLYTFLHSPSLDL